MCKDSRFSVAWPFRSTRTWVLGAAGLAIFLAAGCEEDPATAAVGDPPPGEVPHGPTAPAEPPSTLPPIEWVELSRAPEIDGLEFPADLLTTQRLLVLAVPAGDFPIVKQGERQYRHAQFRDWTLSGRKPAAAGAATAAPQPVLATCLVAVSGTSGQLTVARQRNFTTGKTELAEASVLGDVAALYLLFQIDRTAAPRELVYQGKPLHSCPAEPTPALINKLFLPIKPPGQWVQDVMDFSERPLPCGDFGAVKKLVRRTELMYVDAKGEKITLKPAAGRRFVEIHFAQRGEAFDFTTAEWRLVLTDTTSLAPIGVSANGGQSYFSRVIEGKGFAGQPATLPVVLFEAPAEGTLARLQYKTLTVNLPR